MDDKEQSPSWVRAFDRGRFTLTVLTRGRVRAEGWLGLMRAGAMLLGVVAPDPEDELPRVNIGFVSIEPLRQFISEMEPREIFIWTLPSEDHQGLQVLLQRDASVTLQ